MNKITSRTVLAFGSLTLFCLGFYVGYEIYGRSASRDWASRVDSVLYMATSGAEEKEAWILSALAKDIDQRPTNQSRAAICKLLAIKVAKMKEGHAAHVATRKRIDDNPVSESEEMYAHSVAGAEHALNESGCPE